MLGRRALISRVGRREEVGRVDLSGESVVLFQRQPVWRAQRGAREKGKAQERGEGTGDQTPRPMPSSSLSFRQSLWQASKKATMSASLRAKHGGKRLLGLAVHELGKVEDPGSADPTYQSCLPW